MTGRPTRYSQGGQHALAGFDYQATVILDVFLTALHTEQNVRVRPEGEDDLVLWHQTDQKERRIFYQVKKPSQSGNGELRHDPWSLAKAADSLLSQTLQNLRGNNDQQFWILGDTLSPELRTLLDAGTAAPTSHRPIYLQLLHHMARQHSGLYARVAAVQRDQRRRIQVSAQWFTRIPARVSLLQALDQVQQEVRRQVIAAGAPETAADAYQTALYDLHAALPDVLARTEAHSTFGSEHDVRERVHRALQQHFGIDLDVVRHTLFLNLRGFINDVSKQPGRTISAVDLEDELRSIWPNLNVVGRVSPKLPALARQDLVESVLVSLKQGPAVIMGVSGSGKSALASLIAHTITEHEPRREVFYAACSAGHSVRDVLTGLAHLLRRFGEPQPFSAAIDRQHSDEEVITRIVDAVGQVRTPVTLLVDLTEGTATDEFSRQAAHLTRVLQMSPSQLQLAFLAQENVLSDLSGLEQQTLSIPPPVHVPGLTFSEFVTLAGPRTQAERADLHALYDHFAAGRAAGLSAVQATLLAAAPRVQWRTLSKTSPEEALRLAEERRFGALPAHLRSTAERLVCFFLPFDPTEAQAIFPELPVTDAIRVLRRKGLLAPSASGRLEMHEIVRRGLEALVPPSLQRETHAALAEHYRANLQLSAIIYHLMRSGAPEEARTVARTAFLNGEHLAELRHFVTEQRLVEPQELLPFLERDRLPSSAFSWTDILAQGGSETAQALLELLRRHPERLNDYDWTAVVVGSMVRADPEILALLTRFTLAVVDETKRERLLQVSALQARRALCTVSPAVLTVFDQSPQQHQIQLLPLLLADPNTETLTRVVSLYQQLGAEPRDEHGRPTGLARTGRYLTTGAHVEALLRVLPAPPPGSELALAVPQLGSLTDWIWAERIMLAEHSAALLGGPLTEPVMAFNAMRVLVFLGDERVGALARLHQEDPDPAGAYAMLLPVFSPRSEDAAEHRAALLNPETPVERRLAHLAVLFRLDTDLDELLKDTLAAYPQQTSTWQNMFLMHSVFRTFPGFVSLLLTHLDDEDETQPWTAALVSRLAEIESAEAGDLLLECTAHPSPEVRAVAIQALSYVRRPDAWPALQAADAQGTHGTPLWFAALSSRPTSMDDLTPFLAHLPEAERPLWRAVASARLGDASQGPFIAGLARDPAQLWQVRRAALLAAGHLPYSAALADCADSVLGETSDFALDTSPSLISHDAVATVLTFDPAWLLRIYQEGEERFLALVSGMIGVVQEQSSFPSSSLPPVDVARWFYQHITANVSTSPSPLSATANAIHRPILHAAVYRGYRLTGRIDLLEGEVATPRSEWHLVRALCELLKNPESDRNHLRSLVKGGPYASSISAENALRPQGVYLPEASSAITYTHVTDEGISALLAGTSTPPGPYIFTIASRESSEEFARQLDPVLDNNHQTRILDKPQLQLTSDGPVVVEQYSSYTSSSPNMRDQFRAALVAAGPPDFPLWHSRQIVEFISNGWHSDYIAAYLKALAARSATQIFYQEVQQHGVPLLLALCGPSDTQALTVLIDAKLSPFLQRAVHAGPDTLLRSLCFMVSGLQGQDAHAALTVLASRCIQMVRSAVGEVRNHAPYLALSALLDHPETLKIPVVRLALVRLAGTPLPNHTRRILLRSLKACPEAYLLIERRLVDSVSFEHYLLDQVDELDDAAQGLF